MRHLASARNRGWELGETNPKTRQDAKLVCVLFFFYGSVCAEVGWLLRQEWVPVGFDGAWWCVMVAIVLLGRVGQPAATLWKMFLGPPTLSCLHQDACLGYTVGQRNLYAKRLLQKVKIDFLCTFSDFCCPMWCFQTLRCGCPLTMRQWGGKVSRSVSASTELVSPSEKRSAALNVAVCVGCGRVTIRWPLREFARKRFRESPGRVCRRHRVAVHREGWRLNSLRPPQFVDPILHSSLCMLLLRITHSCKKQVVVVSLILCFFPLFT